jgi:hypothetical protein
MKYQYVRQAVCLFVVLMVLAMTACTVEEPFDAEYARQQMSGKWQCRETSVSEGQPNGYRITVSANGADGLNIGNMAGLQVTVAADLFDARSLHIPAQVRDGFTIKGTGTVNKYKTMTLTFSYEYGNKKVEVIADCTKI